MDFADFDARADAETLYNAMKGIGESFSSLPDLQCISTMCKYTSFMSATLCVRRSYSSLT